MMLKSVTIFIFCVIFVHYTFGKPIKKEPEEEEDPKKQEEAEYLRYLGQVSFLWPRPSHLCFQNFDEILLKGPNS